MANAFRLLIIVLSMTAVLFGGQVSQEIVETVQQKSLDELKKLVAANPSILKARDEGGDTLLHMAAGAGRAPIVEYLAAQGLDLEAKNSQGQSALLYAAYQGHAAVVLFLLEKGVTFQYQDNQGMSPLHFASRQGQREVVALLLAKGASPVLKNQAGQTAVDLAVSAGQGGVILLFRDKGLLDPKSETGAMALHAIAASGERDVVEEFLNSGAVLSAIAPDGKTMVHSAARGGLFKLTERALSSGLDVRAKDKAGRTALYYAVRGGRKEIVDLLLASGADPVDDESEGRTLLHMAEDMGEIDIVNALRNKGMKTKPRPEIPLTKSRESGFTARVGYIANEGFLIASGKKTVLVDALVLNPWGYDNTPPGVLDRMIQKKPPFERIDLLLFSHAHADHFNAGLAVRVLEAHPETVLVGNDAVKDALRQEAGEKFAALAPRIRIFNPAWGTTVEETIADVPLKMFSVNHADFPQEYKTLAFLMDVEGFLLFHLGDSVPQANKKFFEDIGLEKAGIDVAFLDSFFLRDPVGLDILPRLIRPDRIIPMHLRGSEIATIGAELAKSFPNVVLFRDPQEVKVFRAGSGK